MSPPVLLRDVTLREHGQNVPAAGLAVFSVAARVELARRLAACGLRALEVASTASPRLAPAMAPKLLGPLVERLGRLDGVELLTLVPSARGAARFDALGLGPERWDHTMGVFVSAVDEHGLRNTGQRADEAIAELGRFVPAAAARGVRVVGYVSGAWGFVVPGATSPVPASRDRVAALARALVGLGASSLTVSDLQGVGGPAETAALVAELVAELSPSGVPIGYHPHHVAAGPALENVEAALAAGATVVDASLGAVGGCITGAPGNVATEAVARRLEALGLETGIDLDRLEALAAEAARGVLSGH